MERPRPFLATSMMRTRPRMPLPAGTLAARAVADGLAPHGNSIPACGGRTLHLRSPTLRGLMRISLPDRATILRVAETFAIGAVGGTLFQLAGFPAGLVAGSI